MTESKKTHEDSQTIFDRVVFGAMVVLAGALIGTVVHQTLQKHLEELATWAGWTIAITTASIAALIAAHFVRAFTRDLKPFDSKGSKGKSLALPSRLRTIFIYGYIFMFLALGICAAPFFLSAEYAAANQTSRAAGIVLGCLSEDANSVQDPDPQWFLHIGSKVSVPNSEQPGAATNDNPSPEGKVGAASGNRSYAILKGGLVVPLYVVLLALAGGAVSLTRRLPEYQRQVASNAAGISGQSNQPSISAVRARELVVFQIMQVFTAPLIAIVAFAVFSPDTDLAGALLGFLSGFSSETILLRLRKTADALSGKEEGKLKKPTGRHERR